MQEQEETVIESAGELEAVRELETWEVMQRDEANRSYL